MTIQQKLANRMIEPIQDIKEIENELDLLISEVEESGDKSRIANVMEKIELVIHNLEEKHKEEVDIKINRILKTMKPYTIKANDNMRIADLTHEQFVSIVNDESFWFDDEPCPTKTDK